MATANINIRVDETLKKNAEMLFDEIGMNMSTAINIFLKQAVREHGIPFQLKIEMPNAETIRTIEDVKNGCNLKGPFNSVAELMEDLNAEN